MGTSTISIKDNQNNTTVIPFIKLKESNTKLKLVFNQVIRNGVSTITPNTHILYDWSLKNDGTLKDLDTKVIIRGIEKTALNYKKQANTTTIKTKNMSTGQVVVTTRIGFVPVTTITSLDNLLDISY